MKRLLGQLSLIGCLVVGVGAAAGAEILPDSTLPQQSRVTRPRRNQAVITDGTQQGNNLFHSFRLFSVRSGEAAIFQPDAAVRNIFVRVTGREISRINGSVEILQSSANLFLLNPNGIIFGRNATLRLGGSFVATTADQINFADGRTFSAIQPHAGLLSVSTPIGLQLGRRAGRIVSRSTAQPSSPDANPDPFSLGLVGSPAQTLALIGGDLLIAGETEENGGKPSGLRIAGGQIALGSGFDGEVTLTPTAQGWQLGYEQITEFGNLRLQNAVLNVSDAAGGEIQLQGGQITLQNSFAFSNSENSARPGGNLSTDGSRAILVEQGSFFSSSTQGAGRAGNITLSAPQLTIRTGGQVSSLTTGNGRSGNIQVVADSVIVENIATQTGLDSPLSLLNTFSFGSGDSGDLDIVTEQLQVRSGGQIGTTTRGAGKSGNLSVQAREIELVGTAQAPNGQPLLLEGLPAAAGLFAGTEAEGDGGRLEIETARLSIRDGAILQATTYGSGQAGSIRIQAESIQVSGRSAAGGFPARIAATSGGLPEFSTTESSQAIGRGGNLDIATDRLSIQNSGVVAVNSLNPDGAGAGIIRIQAREIELDNRGQLNAQTESGNRARIQIEGAELLTLRRNSNISTRAGIRSDSGDAGNIAVNAGVILAAPAENSNIDADARAGRGGNIAIQSQGILGIAERSQQTPQSDITATSESNVSGEISISTVSFDPTQGIVTLPDTVVDASGLIAQGCRAEGQAEGQAARQSEFVITGRGGLPPNPTDLGSSSAVLPRWVTVPDSSQPSAPNATLPDPALATPAIVEAQGWVTTATGKVSLVAQSPASSPNAPAWELPHCLAPQSPDP